MTPRDYRGTTVIITGAAGGLGSALCRRFGEAGARVVALDLDGAQAEALATRLRAQGIEALGLACDVSGEAACRAAIVRVIDGHGGIDLLVNNAGISARCLLRDADPAVVRRVMAVNFFGAVHATQAALGGDGRTATAPRQTTGAQAQPDEVAARIVEAARRHRRLCLPATTSRLAWWISRLAPHTYERLMLRRVGAEFDTSSRRTA